MRKVQKYPIPLGRSQTAFSALSAFDYAETAKNASCGSTPGKRISCKPWQALRSLRSVSEVPRTLRFMRPARLGQGTLSAFSNQ
jgi:hypothetical protein